MLSSRRFFFLISKVRIICTIEQATCLLNMKGTNYVCYQAGGFSSSYTCFSRNLWRRKKRTTILFLINNYWIHSNNQCWWRVMIHKDYSWSETVKSILQKFFFSYLWDSLEHICLLILVFSGIAFWIRAFNSSSETSSEKRERAAILNYLFSSRRRYLSGDR